MRVNCVFCGEEFSLAHDEYIEIAHNKYACKDCKHKAWHEILVEHLKKKLEEKE